MTQSYFESLGRASSRPPDLSKTNYLEEEPTEALVDVKNKEIDKAIKDSFPGQFGLSERMAGGGMQTHLFTVGYESLAEFEQWEDSASRDQGVSPFDREMDKLAEWHEREIVRNIRVYDIAITLKDFVE